MTETTNTADTRTVVERSPRPRTLRGEPYENLCVGVFTVRMLFGGERAAA